jgi:hypothetical protein
LAKPKYLIVDQGSEFKSDHFKNDWCKNHGILPRFGAVGKHGSIAVVERFHRTFKDILRLATIPEEQSRYEQEASLIIDWYNEHRPHNTLDGKTPNEVYFFRQAANEQPTSSQRAANEQPTSSQRAATLRTARAMATRLTLCKTASRSSW